MQKLELTVEHEDLDVASGPCEPSTRLTAIIEKGKSPRFRSRGYHFCCTFISDWLTAIYILSCLGLFCFSLISIPNVLPKIPIEETFNRTSNYSSIANCIINNATNSNFTQFTNVTEVTVTCYERNPWDELVIVVKFFLLLFFLSLPLLFVYCFCQIICSKLRRRLQRIGTR